MPLFEVSALLLLLWVVMSAAMLTLWGILSWAVVSIIRHTSDRSLGFEAETGVSGPEASRVNGEGNAGAVANRDLSGSSAPETTSTSCPSRGRSLPGSPSQSRTGNRRGPSSRLQSWRSCRGA